MSEELPPGEERVRSLLAASSLVPPMPAQVAARLDAVLASLAVEREAQQGTQPAPMPLKRRRRSEPDRRRWVPMALAAAAAVVIVGVGLGANGLLGAGGSDTSASSTSDKAGPHADDGADGGADGGDDGGSAEARLAVPSLRSSTLTADVRRAARLTADADPGDPSLSGSGGTDGARTSLGCLVPGHDSLAQVVAVRLDGRPATLVLPDTPTGVAVVYACDDVGAPVARTRVGG